MKESRDERSGQILPPGRARLVAVAVVLLALALRLHTFSRRTLWHDEGWTLSFVYLDDPWQIITFGLARFNPPVLAVTHYLIAWIGAHLLGTTLFALRAPSVLFGALAVAAIYAAGAVLFAPETGLIAAAFSAVNVLQISHSQVMRMYPLFLLLSWSSIGLLVRALRAGRSAQWVLYGAVTLLLIYAHNYAAFVLAAQALYLLVILPWRRAAALLVRLTAFWAAAYAPAVVVFARAERAGRAMVFGVPHETSLRDLLRTYQHLTVANESSILFLACVLPIIVFGAWRLMAEPQLRGALAMVGFLAATPVLVWCLLPPGPFSNERYFIFAAPALLLLLGQGLREIRPPALRLLLIGGLLASSLPALSYYYDDAANPPFDRAAAYIKSADPDLPLVFVASSTRIFNYYYVAEFPRLGSPDWYSLAARMPRRGLLFDSGAKDPFRPPPCDDIFCERIAPGLFWTGDAIANIAGKLDPSIARSFWLVDMKEPASDQGVQDPRCRLVGEREFDRVRVRRYTFVR